MTMRVDGEATLAAPQPPSRRERSKNARRERIVDAAYALLREIDMDAISVKAIADRADVSAATVYNLFGTKGTVLAQVYERDFLAFEEQVAAQGAGDALELIFAAAEIAAARCGGDPRFYRAILAVRDPGGASPQETSAHRVREAFWTRRIEEAVAAGLLRADTDATRVAVVLIQIAAGAVSHWISNLISADELAHETTYGFAAALSPFAVKPAEARLRERLFAQPSPAAPTKGRAAPTRLVEAA